MSTTMNEDVHAIRVAREFKGAREFTGAGIAKSLTNSTYRLCPNMILGSGSSKPLFGANTPPVLDLAELVNIRNAADALLMFGQNK